MKNTRFTCLLAAPFFAIFLTIAGGCGGSGGTSFASTNAFEGTYTGDFLSSASPTVISPITFTVNSAGGVQGSGGPTGSSEAITGGVGNSGTCTFSIAGTAGTFTGNLANNGLVFYVTLTNAAAGKTSYLTLVKNPKTYKITGTNPYAGPYAGTDDNTSDHIAGPVAFTIDGSGNITAVALDNHQGQASFTLLSGSVSGSGAASGTFNLIGTEGGVSIGSGAGKLALAAGVLSGNFVVTNGQKTTDASLDMNYLGTLAQ